MTTITHVTNGSEEAKAAVETWNASELEPFLIPQEHDGDGTSEGEAGEESDDETDDNNSTEGDIDDAHRKMEDKLGNSEDVDKDDLDKKEKNNKTPQRSSTPQQGSKSRDSAPSEFDYKNVKPAYSWEALLRKLVSDVSNQTEDSYQRVNRRNITGMHTASQTGMGVVKPGEIELDAKIKLAFIVDSSGSMSADIARIYSNMMNLLKRHREALNGDFFLIKFSNDFHVYRANFAKGKFVELSGVDDNDKKELGSGNLEKLFSQHFGSSTYFGADLVAQAEKLVAKKYNVILVTDTDIIASENSKNLIDLYKKAKNQLYIIAADRENYTAIIQAIDQISKNITYMT